MTKLKIIVTDIAASSGGALSILQDFYHYIRNHDKDNEWIFLLSDNYIEESENIKVIILKDVKLSWVNRLKFDFFEGRHLINKLNPDVVFSLQNTCVFGLNIKQLVYVHQPLPFQNVKKFSFLKKNEKTLAIYQYIIGYIIKKSIKEADKIVVQTKWMRNAIIKNCKISEEKIMNIAPEVGDYSSYKKNSFNKSSFIYPTSEAIYKNNECIYEASTLIRKKGMNNFTIKITLPAKKTMDNIDFIGKVQREQLINEYNTSTLIFPSYIETFGLPMAEARQMGGIILASNCDFSREILSGYNNAYFFDPFKPEELASLIMKVLSGEIIRKNIDEEYDSTGNSWETVKNMLINL